MVRRRVKVAAGVFGQNKGALHPWDRCSAQITVVTYLTLVTTDTVSGVKPPGISLPHPGNCNRHARAAAVRENLSNPNKIRVVLNFFGSHRRRSGMAIQVILTASSKRYMKNFPWTFRDAGLDVV
jgi:hypothetical protein